MCTRRDARQQDSPSNVSLDPEMLFLLVAVSPSYDPILLWFVLASCRPSGRPAVSGAYTLKVEKLSFDARTLSHSLAVPETEPLPRGLPVGTPLAPSSELGMTYWSYHS